jgi:hypothetical protein
VLIALLAAIATSTGILTAGGPHRTFLSLRGESVPIQGGGLYSHESVSGAAQAIGQDWVTLVVAVPLLLLATYLAASGSFRSQLLRIGVLWYFAYTYLIMAFGAAYNQLFLVYVALYSASLFALVLSVLSIDVAGLPGHLQTLARRAIAWLMIGIGGALLLMWLGRIVPPMISGGTPFGLESYSTLFVQAADVGLAVPLAVVGGLLLLRRHPMGYLLAVAVLVKGTTLGLALIAMVIAMLAAGVHVAIPDIVFSLAVTVLGAAAGLHLFASISTGAQAKRVAESLRPVHHMTPGR